MAMPLFHKLSRRGALALLVLLLSACAGEAAQPSPSPSTVLSAPTPTLDSTQATPTSAPAEPSPAAQPGWSERTGMPTPRSEMPAVLLAGKIYVPGGLGDGPAAGESLEVYDPAADS